MAKIYLEKNGVFAVDTVSSIVVVLDQLNTKQYDVIISDYQMPEMDRIELRQN
ncbi:MAG: response regulator [Methanomicrobiales archaeon]|nr:response regulator [Methanomicrobiales archaeon]